METILRSPEILNTIDKALRDRGNNSQNAQNESRRLFNCQIFTETRPATLA